MNTRKKRWLLVPILAVLLTIGITAGVAMAHGGGGDGLAFGLAFARPFLEKFLVSLFCHRWKILFKSLGLAAGRVEPSLARGLRVRET